MGDRGNVYVTNTSDADYVAKAWDHGSRGIYLYSHWDGSELPTMVRDALKVGKGRWNDDSYLTRIIIDQITKSGRDAETGYGVSLTITDNSHPITIVDLGTQSVAWASEGDERDPSKWKGAMSFADYVLTDGRLAYPTGVKGRWG